MSYALGSRIKELRTIRKVSQEQMADVLETTRQRYSRIENGQVDISYVMIKKIANYLGVPTSEITSAEEEKKELITFFREKSASRNVVDCVARIEEILKTFNAHEKLYFQMRMRDGYVD
ncbi:MAG: helix-turn-helix transcriptional regulator [Clostridiales bacterium]|nr:helix-turn-helix transcriptional regulator [Clostridiales bacterium]